MKSMIAQLIDEEIQSTTNLGETTQDFILRISEMIMQEIHEIKAYAPAGFGTDVVEEIEQEILEIFRIKTYGYYDLPSFRRASLKRHISTAS